MAPELILSLKKSLSDSSDNETCEYSKDKLEKYKSGDVFALGVTLFTMVVGTPPFVQATKDDSNYRAFLLSIKKPGSFRFWTRHHKAKEMYANNELSLEFIALIQNMLHPDPEKRITINSVMSHPWIIKHMSSKSID